MDIARINLANVKNEQGDKEMFLAFKNACKNKKINCPIIIDTQGPSILLGLPNDKPIEFTKGSEVYITANRHINRSSSVLYCDYSNLPYQVKPGDKILVENGKVSFTVKKVVRECDTILVENNAGYGKEIRVLCVLNFLD